VRRRATERRRGDEALRRPRLAALKARQPFLNPILAYFLGSPGLGTRVPSKEPLLSDAQSSGTVLTIPVRAVMNRAGVIDIAFTAAADHEVRGLAHVIHTAQLQLSLPTAGQSISRDAITDFIPITIRQQRRHQIPRSSKNRAGREPSRVCVCWHTGQLLNLTPPAPASCNRICRTYAHSSYHGSESKARRTFHTFPCGSPPLNSDGRAPIHNILVINH